MVLAAGLWSALLLILRLFDKPGITQHGVAANVGIQWGIFFALAAAGLLAYAGSRMRAGQRPEPPLLRRDRTSHDPHNDPPRSPQPAPPRGERWDSDLPDRQPVRAEDPPRPPEQEPTVAVPRRTPVPAKPRSRGRRVQAPRRGAALLRGHPPGCRPVATGPPGGIRGRALPLR